jgi:DNA-binding response OmpR family regulator
LKKRYSVKIIASAGHDEKSLLIDEMGFDDCLMKPFNAEDLQELISKHLDK